MTSLPLVFDEPRRAKKPPRHLADLTGEERRTAVAALGEPAFRAKQLSNHYFSRLVSDPAEMTDLPAATRDKLVAELMPPLLTRVRDMECDNGQTRKTLWKLLDGSLVESVLMRYPDRTTMCVSSQAGCGMACPFCATGQAGLTRNMTTAEIVEQVVDGARALSRGEIAGGPGRVSNIVFMGMGEPMANYKAVIGAVRRFTDPSPEGLGISALGVTVSTVGLVPRINQLADRGDPGHARAVAARAGRRAAGRARADQQPLEGRRSARRRLGLRAADQAPGVDRVRDDPRYQRPRVAGRPAGGEAAARGDWGWVHVNLIPLNPTPGSKWTASDPADEREFVRRLEAGGIPTTVRDTRGQEIDGACGQLAAANK